MKRRLLILAAAVLLTAAAVTSAVALHGSRMAPDSASPAGLTVGDCVTVTAQPPAAVSTQPAPCSDDPSYTVGALTDASGDCPTTEYQQFPAADQATARLCLVPNLLAAHCYRLGMPIGVVEAADCTESRGDGPDTGVLVQITQRLDVHDRHACPSTGGNHAWPYPSPARTYCTATLF